MMRSEEEVRAQLRHFFQQTLHFRRLRNQSYRQGNSSQADWDGTLALLYESGFKDLYWVLHPVPVEDEEEQEEQQS